MAPNPNARESATPASPGRSEREDGVVSVRHGAANTRHSRRAEAAGSGSRREGVTTRSAWGRTRRGWRHEAGRGVREKAWGRRGRRAACSAEVVTLAAAGEDDDVFVGDLLPFSALSRGDVLAVFFSS